MKHSLLKTIILGCIITFAACSKNDDIKPDDSPKDIDTTEKVPDDTIPQGPEIIGYKYYGAELYSKESFLYGRFEARMKMAYAPGCISSMFLYYNGSDNGEVWNEIDIEVIGKSNKKFQSNIITGTKDNRIQNQYYHKLPDGSVVDTLYHTYVIDWTPDYVSWSVDGTLIRKEEITKDTILRQVESLVKKESLRFNLWASESSGWVGLFNEEKIPITQHIDYVKVYSYEYDSINNVPVFTEKWADDFDSEFNTSRWNKGNWQMELVRERPANVYVENGELLLNLTKEPIYAE